MNDIQYLKMALFFAIPPNQERLCGREISKNEIFDLCQTSNERKIIDFLSTFKVLNLYLTSLAKYHSFSPWDSKIIDEYPEESISFIARFKVAMSYMQMGMYQKALEHFHSLLTYLRSLLI